MDNLFVVFTDSKEFRDANLEMFAKLPFKHKIFLSAKLRIGFRDIVFVKDYAVAPFVSNVTKKANKRST